MKREGWVGSALGLTLLVGLVFGGVGAGITTEVPTGRVEGVVLLDGKKPLPGALISLLRLDQDDVLRNDQAGVETDAEGKFRLMGLPDGTYTVEVAAKAHSLAKETKVRIREGQVSQLQLDLKPNDPFLRVYAQRRVFLPTDRPFIQANGFLKSTELKVELWKFSMDRLLQGDSLYSAVSELRSKVVPNEKPTRSTAFDISATDVEGTFEKTLEMDSLEPGIYLGTVTPTGKVKGEPEGSSVLFYVSEVALVAKLGRGQANAFVTDLKTGEPLEGVEIKVASKGSQQGLGATDEDGLLQAPLTLPTDNQATVLLAQKGESVAVVNLRDYNSDEKGAVHIVTDRPIYRPGDTVHWRAIARTRAGDDWKPLTGGATVKVTNDDGDTTFRGAATLGQYGTASGSFALPEGDVRPYSLDFEAGGISESRWISVSSYRKPAFEVEVIPEAPVIVRGDTARMKVRCTYFFGGPVVGAKVTGSVNHMDLWWSPSPDDDFEYEDEGYGGGEYAGDLPEVTTNEAGEAWISYPTNSLIVEGTANVDKQIEFRVSVSEDGQRYYDGTGRLKVARGDTDLRLNLDSWVVRPGEAVSGTVSVSDLQGKPMVSQTVTVEYGLEQYHSNGTAFVKLGTQTLKTDAQGKAALQVKAERGGSYRFTARLRDSKGRPVEDSGYVWAYAEGGDWGTESDLEIALDKKEYKVGEPVTAIVRSRLKEAAVWVAMETNRVVEQKLVRLKNGAAEVQLTAPDSRAKNAFVSAQTVSNRSFYQRSKSFRTGLEAQALTVTLTPDRPEAKPGERIGVAILAKDANGQPVAADFSLGIVDEAIYAIQEDRDDPMDTFYPRRWSPVSTDYSFPEIFLDGGDKDAAKVQIRKDFRDTAAWYGSVVTGADGRARTEITLPDNITGWRATAVGVTKATQLGKTKVEFVTKKDLMVRLVAPSFLNQFDRAGLTAMVQNGTDRPLTTQVRLEATGVSAESAAPQSVQLAAGESKPVSWVLKDPVPGTAMVRVIATSTEGPSDGMELTIPVAVFGVDQVVSANQDVSPDEPFSVDIPDLPASGSGEVVVDLASSRIDSLVSSLDDLIDYPYGCVEQTMSRFVPAVQVRSYLRTTGRSDAAMEARIDDVAAKSITRLKGMQHSDGGFGWWENDSSNQRMTALVLDGLADAKAAGLPLEGRWIDRALEWAAGELQRERDQKSQTEWRWDRDPIGLAAAALRHRDMPVAAQRLAAEDVTKTESTRDLARLAIGLKPFNQDLAQTALDAALGRAANGLADEWWWEGDATRALLLRAAVVMDAPQATSLADELMARRRGRGWRSTYDTAQVLSAMTNYLAQSGGLDPAPRTVTVRLGDQVIETVTLSPDAKSRHRIVLDSAQLRGGDALTIATEGASVYAQIAGRVRTPQADIRPLETQGVKIERSLHKLTSGQTAEGRTGLVAEKNPISTVKSGDLVRCQIRVNVPKKMEFVLVEVPLPSNMRVQESTDLEYWSYWFSGMEIFDDKVAFFATELAKGEHLFEFHLRAENNGDVNVLPARVMPMYRPTEVSASASLKVGVE